MTPAPTCACCGTTAGPDSPAATWSMGLAEDGRRMWTCAPCTRAELAGIESGVPAPRTGQLSTSSIST